MKQVEWLERLTQAYQFEEVASEDGCTYILRASYEREKVGVIEDRTAFEAVENHVHLLDWVKLKEYKTLERIAPTLCTTLLASLKYQYPGRNFSAYVTITLHDSMILRFHQNWEGEASYYDENTRDPQTSLFVARG